MVVRKALAFFHRSRRPIFADIIERCPVFEGKEPVDKAFLVERIGRAYPGIVCLDQTWDTLAILRSE